MGTIFWFEADYKDNAMKLSLAMVVHSYTTQTHTCRIDV